MGHRATNITVAVPSEAIVKRAIATVFSGFARKSAGIFGIGAYKACAPALVAPRFPGVPAMPLDAAGLDAVPEGTSAVEGSDRVLFAGVRAREVSAATERRDGVGLSRCVRRRGFARTGLGCRLTFSAAGICGTRAARGPGVNGNAALGGIRLTSIYDGLRIATWPIRRWRPKSISATSAAAGMLHGMRRQGSTPKGGAGMVCHARWGTGAGAQSPCSLEAKRISHRS
jgi:hypothetical protein